ncbi:hypothetical protein ACRRTK_005035 [Alexandromys fortis]
MQTNTCALNGTLRKPVALLRPTVLNHQILGVPLKAQWEQLGDYKIAQFGTTLLLSLEKAKPRRSWIHRLGLLSTVSSAKQNGVSLIIAKILRDSCCTNHGTLIQKQIRIDCSLRKRGNGRWAALALGREDRNEQIPLYTQSSIDSGEFNDREDVTEEMIKHLMMKFEVNVGITWIVTMIRIIANSIFKWDTLFFMMTVSHGVAEAYKEETRKQEAPEFALGKEVRKGSELMTGQPDDVGYVHHHPLLVKAYVSGYKQPQYSKGDNHRVRTTYKEVKTRDSMFRGDILLLIITETLGTHAVPQDVPRRSFMHLHT